MSDAPADASKIVRPTLRLVSESVQKALFQPEFAVPANTISSPAFEREDEYFDMYIGASRDRGLLEPPFPLRVLERLTHENNTLSPCIEAMVTNIDGTGFHFENKDPQVEDDAEKAVSDELVSFFAEVWPGESFLAVRKKVRRDIEATGNGYIEILRNAQDEIAFIRHLDAKMLRMVKLDEPVPVKTEVQRRGKKVTLTVMQRERRFAQLVNGVTLVYFKEFKSSRDCDRKTGTWTRAGVRLPANERATEIMHFTCLPDSHTPYGIPRWLSQLPSVLGSRKAEEFNMEFFDNGGVPPALVILQGGTLQTESRKALEQKLTGPAKKRNRIEVLEVEPTGGSLDKTAQARVTVERFGGDRTNDSMFEEYDAKCSERIRKAFRLPPMFIGSAGDYAFATAFVSHTVTEAQVFKPERDAFDTMMTMKLLPDLGYDQYKMVSEALTIEDVANKMQGIRLFMNDPRVSDEDIISAINDSTGLHFKLVPLEDRPVPEGLNTVDEMGNIVPANDNSMPPGEKDEGEGGATDKEGAKQSKEKSARQKEAPITARQAAPVRQPQPVKARKGDALNVLDLAQNTMVAMRDRDNVTLAVSLQEVAKLDGVGMAAFRKACALMTFADPTHDPEGMAELAMATTEILGRTKKADACCA